MLDRPTIRWMLRALGDDACLPIYLGNDGEPPSSLDELRRELKLVFGSLRSDSEHPESRRVGAWKELEKILGELDGNGVIPSFYAALIKRLRQEMDGKPSAELARFWAWPELADEPLPSPSSDSDYQEIHAHYRGSVPFDHLWLGLMKDPEARAPLRKRICTAGLWRRTRAELAEYAAELRHGAFGEGTSSGRREPTKELAEEKAFRQRCVASLSPDMVIEDPVDPILAVRYLALYVNFRRFLLHQRGNTGLVSFSKSFGRISKLTKRALAPNEMVTAILQRFERSGATTVELRPTLDPTRRETQHKLRAIVLGYFDYLKQHHNGSPIAMGIVPSLYKQEVTNSTRWCNHGQTKDGGLIERLKRQQVVWQRQVEGLLAIIDEVPALRLFVVGLDVAGIEPGSPVRGLAPAFELVHEHHRQWNLECSLPCRNVPIGELQRELKNLGENASRLVWDRLNDGDAGAVVPTVRHERLGLTAHAGEDFVDPFTGLREIWEAVECLGLRRGDRMGHAIALSLDPERLRTLLRRRAECPEIPSVQCGCDNLWRLRKPMGTHVLDLAWSHELDRVETHSAHAEIALATARAMGTVPIHHAILDSLRCTTYPPAVAIPGVCYLDHDTLEPELSTWIEIDEAWLSRFERLRRVVAAKLRGVGIVVESCPTSNCAVANLDEPPLFGLLDIDPPLNIAIATDDPGVLGAWPEHELGRLNTPKFRDYRERLLRTNARASFVRMPRTAGN